MKTKNSFIWKRNTGNMEIPANTNVEELFGIYWIDPNTFKYDSFEWHSAYYYGIRVEKENINFEE